MKARMKKYEERSPIEFLLLRDRLGMRRYKKKVRRSEEEKKILLEIGYKKIKEKEKDDFISLGFRRRRVKIESGKIMGKGIEER